MSNTARVVNLLAVVLPPVLIAVSIVVFWNDVVGVRVVLAVVGDPGDDRALDRHRAEGREEVLDRLARHERPVGQHPVEADRHAQRSGQVEAGEQGEVVPADAAVPGTTTATTKATNGIVTASRLEIRAALDMTSSLGAGFSTLCA